MQTGRIIKLLAGFYYVELSDKSVYVCRAKGLFRKTGEKPLVGDLVKITITDEKDMEGSLQEILPRKSALDRPPVANIDRVLIIQSIFDPAPRLMLTDRYLVMAEYSGIKPIIGFSKLDLGEDGQQEIMDHYRASGYDIFFFSTKTGDGLLALRQALHGHITTLAGPSGAGKSSLINVLCGEERMETGTISKKLGRGKQTTRHTELIRIDEDTWMSDTPGFGTVALPVMDPLDLDDHFPEFAKLSAECRFAGCSHITEPSCAVRHAVAAGEISESRYNSYVSFYNELASQTFYK